MRLPVFSPPLAREAMPSRPRVLWLSCVAHAMHDGYTDMIYALLPVWQSEFGLDFAALAILRGIYAGAMAALQLPAGWLAQRLGSRVTLASGTLLAALGYAIAGMSGGLIGLCVALAISGSGSSTQHPIASGAVSRTFGRDARGPLSLYNFSGDLGKSILPAAISVLVTVMSWRHALWIAAAMGAIVAAVIVLMFPAVPRSAGTAAEAGTGAGTEAEAPPGQRGDRGGTGKRGFSTLFSIGVLDTAVRMGLLTFLPFLLAAKGISPGLLGTALALVFVGGAAGKFVCGWLGARMGVVRTVLFTEGGTAVSIVALIYLPLPLAMVLLPMLGMMLNGTSSVLYGTVPELTAPEGAERAFAIF